MKKILFLLLTVVAFTACNDEKEPKFRYATENNAIVDGHLTGTNMTFLGTSTVTDAKGDVFTDKEAYFEFADGVDDFALYLHKTRFAADMPGVEMRLYTVHYTGKGDNSIAFSEPSIIPEAKRDNEDGSGWIWQPVERFKITDLEGSIDGVDCRISFICGGVYDVAYEGKLIVRN